MSLFKELQMLIFEYLNFRPFFVEFKDKMYSIKERLDTSYPTDLGRTRVVICNIKHSSGFTFFGIINPKKNDIIFELFKRMNNRRIDLGLKTNPITYGFGDFVTREMGELDIVSNACYIAY